MTKDVATKTAKKRKYMEDTIDDDKKKTEDMMDVDQEESKRISRRHKKDKERLKKSGKTRNGDVNEVTESEKRSNESNEESSYVQLYDDDNDHENDEQEKEEYDDFNNEDIDDGEEEEENHNNEDEVEAEDDKQITLYNSKPTSKESSKNMITSLKEDKDNDESTSMKSSCNKSVDDDNSHESNDVKSQSPKKLSSVQPVVNFRNSTVTFPTSAVHEHLICKLCDGLYRDPFTISECLHTFCKSCIFFAFQDIGLHECPRCRVALGPDPFKAILFDRTLQELVDKLFPELKERDMQENVRWMTLMKNEGCSEEEAFYAVRAAMEGNDGSNGVDDSERCRNRIDQGFNTGGGVDTFENPVSTRSQSKSHTSNTEDAEQAELIHNYTPVRISLFLWSIFD